MCRRFAQRSMGKVLMMLPFGIIISAFRLLAGAWMAECIAHCHWVRHSGDEQKFPRSKT
jgi:hypothetical protein